ncbi:MAG: RNA polymerase sigma factor [Bacteroidota bacterium]
MEDERELILQCLRQEVSAQRTLFNWLAPKMYPLCLQFVNNRDEAEDILQTAFLRVFTNLHKYRFEGSFEGWVRRIIINTAINFIRQQCYVNHDVNVEQLGNGDSVCEDALSKMSAKEILSILQTLPGGHWEVFRLHEIDGYEHKEIGMMLGISEGTSKSQLHRARISIRRKLRGLGMGGFP